MSHRIDNTDTRTTVENLTTNSLTNLNSDTFVLPTTQGTVGQAMVNDGNGNLTWTTISTLVSAYSIHNTNVGSIQSSVVVDTVDTITVTSAANPIATFTMNNIAFQDTSSNTVFQVAGIGAASKTTVMGTLTVEDVAAHKVNISNSPSQTTNYDIVLPPTQATAPNQVAVNDGSGNLSWQAISAASAQNIKYTPTTVTTNTTLSTTTLVNVDATAGAVVLTLPPQVANVGQLYIVNKIDSTANLVTLQPTIGEKLNRVTNATIILQFEDDRTSVFSNGTKGWFTI